MHNLTLINAHYVRGVLGVKGQLTFSAQRISMSVSAAFSELTICFYNSSHSHTQEHFSASKLSMLK